MVFGKVHAPAPSSAYSAEAAHRLLDTLNLYALSAGGRARFGMLFLLPSPDDATRCRRPDVAFLSEARWPAARGDSWPVVPDFICEVTGPDDGAANVMDKVFEFLTAGVRLVWVIFPTRRQIYAYTSATPRVFGPGEVADGGDVLPGFRVAVEGLFPPSAAPE